MRTKVIGHINKHLSAIIFCLIAIILVQGVIKAKRWNERIIDYDVAHYYGYLPSSIIYNDLSLQFDSADQKFLANKIWYNKLQDGRKVFKVSMGVAMAYAPAFLTVHSYQKIAKGDTSGFSAPYKWALVISALVYAFLGLFYLRKILLSWFNQWVTSLVMLAIMLATNLYTYIVFDPGMSHVYSFAIINIFIWNTIQWNKRPVFLRSMVIGLLIGWIFLIRPVNLLVVLIFMGWGITQLSDIVQRARFLLKHWKHIIIIILSAFVICIPQFLYWKIYTGQWLFYSYVGEQFFFNHPRILEGLFSWRKGWLLYTPVMVLSLMGLFFAPKKLPELKWILPITILLILYITCSWWCWWYGGGFGQRSLIDWYGWLAIPMAAFFQTAWKRNGLFMLLAVLVLGTIYLNRHQHNQYTNTSIHYDSMTREAYFYKFWKRSKHPNLEPLLRSPDYEKAKLGEREYFWD